MHWTNAVNLKEKQTNTKKTPQTNIKTPPPSTLFFNWIEFFAIQHHFGIARNVWKWQNPHQLQGTNGIYHLATCSYVLAGLSDGEWSMCAVLCSWEQTRIGGLMVGLGLGSKIISHKLSVRDASSSGVSRARGLTCHRHWAPAILSDDSRVCLAPEKCRPEHLPTPAN